MRIPAIDPAHVDFEKALYARMTADYTTTSFNLGERSYIADYIYRVDRHMLAEIQANGVGYRFTAEHIVPDPETGYLPHPVAHCVLRPLVAIMSKVTRWFSATGQDTYYLTADEVSRVPSNLAAWLIQAGHAVAA